MLNAIDYEQERESGLNQTMTALTVFASIAIALNFLLLPKASDKTDDWADVIALMFFGPIASAACGLAFLIATFL